MVLVLETKAHDEDGRRLCAKVSTWLQDGRLDVSSQGLSSMMSNQVDFRCLFK